MELWVAGLAFLLLVLVLGTVHVVRRALGVYRAFRAAGRALADALGKLETSLERFGESAERAAGAGERVLASSARLGDSLARLRLLRRALDRAREHVAGVAGVTYPRK